MNIFKQRLHYYGYEDTQCFDLKTSKRMIIFAVTLCVSLLLSSNNFIDQVRVGQAFTSLPKT